MHLFFISLLRIEIIGGIKQSYSSLGSSSNGKIPIGSHSLSNWVSSLCIIEYFFMGYVGMFLIFFIFSEYRSIFSMLTSNSLFFSSSKSDIK